MAKALVTMRIEVLEAHAVVNFINKINIEDLSFVDLTKINEVLDKKRAETSMELYKRKIQKSEEKEIKKADQDGNPNQQ